MESLGRKISILRKTQGLNQEQLSIKSKIARRTIQNIEGGKVMSPGVEVIAAIAKSLNTTVSELIGEKNTKSKSELILEIQAGLTTLDYDQLKTISSAIEDLTELEISKKYQSKLSKS